MRRQQVVELSQHDNRAEPEEAYNAAAGIEFERERDFAR